MQRFTYLSPDGFPISHDTFKTREEADAFFEKWLKRFATQGYYATADGDRIPLADLRAACELERYAPNISELHEHMDRNAQALLVTDSDRPIGVIIMPEDGDISMTLWQMLRDEYDAVPEFSDNDLVYDTKTGVLSAVVGFTADEELFTATIYLTIIAKY